MTSHESRSTNEPGIPFSELEELPLPPNQETRLSSNFSPSELGLPPGVETVNGVINVGKSPNHEQTFAVASARNEQTGVVDVLVYKLGVNSQGELGYQADESIPFEINSTSMYWFGRNPQLKKPDEPGYQLPDESGHVSRLHFGLRKDETGAVFIGDANSLNGISTVTRKNAGGFEQQDMPPTAATPQASAAVLRTSGVEKPQGMITHVPTQEELVATKRAQAQEQEQEQADRLRERRQDVEAEIDDIKSRYSEEVGLDMWRYASGLMNKADAQREGLGAESTAYGQQAGQAWRRLTPEQQQDAERYHSLMVELENL